MKREFIGRGRTAEIFAWGDHQALKLFYAGWSASFAKAEADQSQWIYQAGLPAPAVDGVIELEDRYGILYERVVRRYFQLRPVSRNELRAWQLPVAVARLSEGIVEEETRLLAIISASFPGR